ncbi:cysteine desulfurase [bacterium]|nr:cysteine desulfurase [bacterium]
MKKRIYCDYNATTPVIPAVKKAYIKALDVYGNASSLHETGRMAKEALEGSRMAFSSFINAIPEQILFCSSGTEANNQVLQQLITRHRDEGPVHVLVSAIEHSSVLETVKILESWGIEVELIPVTAEGLVEVDTLVSLLKPHTKLVSVMFANNEIGSIQDIAALSKVVKDHGALFHCDAVQALGKVSIDVSQLAVDFMTFSAHKIGAPKGVGILYTKSDDLVTPLLYGGKHERGLRASTENIPGIIATGAAIECLDVDAFQEHTQALKKHIKEVFHDLSGVYFNGPINAQALSNTLNISFEGCEGYSLAMNCDLEGIDISTGSACSVGSVEPSHVLNALGISRDLNLASLRFSFGLDNTLSEITAIVECISAHVKRIRSL